MKAQRQCDCTFHFSWPSRSVNRVMWEERTVLPSLTPATSLLAFQQGLAPFEAITSYRLTARSIARILAVLASRSLSVILRARSALLIKRNGQSDSSTSSRTRRDGNGVHRRCSFVCPCLHTNMFWVLESRGHPASRMMTRVVGHGEGQGSTLEQCFHKGALAQGNNY